MELLIVVAIIGILSAVGIVGFGGLLGGAKDAAATENHNRMASFMETILTQCSTKPTGSVPMGSGTYACATSITSADTVFANYLNTEFKSPMDTSRGMISGTTSTTPASGYSTLYGSGTSLYLRTAVPNPDNPSVAKQVLIKTIRRDY